MWLFYYFNFERNYDDVKESMLFVEKKKINKIETKSRMGNPTHTFREMNLVPQLI